MAKWVKIALLDSQFNMFQTKDNLGQTQSRDGIRKVGDVSGGMQTWEIDLDIWRHLAGGILDNLAKQPRATASIAMNWKTFCSNVPIWGGQDGDKLKSCSLMGGKILTLEAGTIRDGQAIQAAAKAIYRTWPGSYELTQNDPRHIGTHSYRRIGNLHKHIVKRGGQNWSNMDLMRLDELLRKKKRSRKPWSLIFRSAANLRKKIRNTLDSCFSFISDQQYAQTTKQNAEENRQ